MLSLDKADLVNSSYKEVTSYQEAENYLLRVPKFAKKNTVEDTGIFLDVLGNPGCSKKIIHVAGTNGKGSVCAYLSSILCTAGYSVGMFTSPHLIEMRERFRVDGIPVERKEFVEAFHQVMGNLEDMRKSCKCEDYHPTFFELLFLMGMIIFEQKKTDFIILETGLGGRLDATNCINNPILSVITEIGLDHMQYLGDTIEEIAGEKAGILKQSVPVVFSDKRKESSEVIVKRAETLGIQAFPVKKEDYFDVKVTNKNIDFSFHSRYYNYIRLSITARALYQVENAALAVRCIETLDTRHSITEKQIKSGIKKTIWEGRMEEVLPDVYVDGAHNEDGIRAFVETVECDGCVGRRYLLFSASLDKDYDTMIRLLEKNQLFEKTAVAKFNNPRTAALKQMQEVFEKYDAKDCTYHEDVQNALKCLISEKEEKDYIYIVGSLYLVGEIKAMIGRKTDD